MFLAVIATTLGKAIDQRTRDKNSITRKHHHTKLVGLQYPSRTEKQSIPSRCSNSDDIQNFSQLKVDDLALLILLFQLLDENITEHGNILRDIGHLSESISKLNYAKTKTGSIY